MWYQILYATALVACASYALGFGGAPERLAVLVILIGSVLSVLVFTTSFKRVEWGVFGIDLIDQMILMVIMMRSDRFWPIWLAAVHMMSLLIAIASSMVPAIERGIYDWTEQSLAYVLLLIIAVGTYRHRVRVRRYGVDPSWTASSSSSTGS